MRTPQTAGRLRSTAAAAAMAAVLGGCSMGSLLEDTPTASTTQAPPVATAPAPAPQPADQPIETAQIPPPAGTQAAPAQPADEAVADQAPSAPPAADEPPAEGEQIVSADAAPPPPQPKFSIAPPPKRLVKDEETAAIAPVSAKPRDSGLRSDGQKLLVTVNDQPITDFDVSQRLTLRDLIGDAGRGTPEQQRKVVLQQLIDEVIVRTEAKKDKFAVSDKQINEQIERISRGLGGPETLSKTLNDKGLSMVSLRRYVEGLILMRWNMQKQSGGSKLEADKDEVDRRFEQISNDVRLKPVVVYQIQEIILPVEPGGDEATRKQIIYSRAMEAQQIRMRMKSCAGARKASDGVFNVKIGKQMEAMADRMPPEMKKILDKTGVGNAIGPVMGPEGVKLIAFCGKRNVEPPKPTREQVENLVLNERYASMAERAMRELRRKAFIEYKDASLQQK